MYFVIPVPFSLSFFFFLCVFVFFFCSHWSLVDVPLIFFCPADHVPDWQPRVLLGMVEARSVNVKKTTTTTTYLYQAGGEKDRPKNTTKPTHQEEKTRTHNHANIIPRGLLGGRLGCGCALVTQPNAGATISTNGIAFAPFPSAKSSSDGGLVLRVCFGQQARQAHATDPTDSIIH